MLRLPGAAARPLLEREPSRRGTGSSAFGDGGFRLRVSSKKEASNQRQVRAHWMEGGGRRDRFLCQAKPVRTRVSS